MTSSNVSPTRKLRHGKYKEFDGCEDHHIPSFKEGDPLKAQNTVINGSPKLQGVKKIHPLK